MAIEDMEAQRSELQQLREKGRVYCSAILDAMEQRENMLTRTELFAIHYPNLLIPVENADDWIVSGEHALGACFQVGVPSCTFSEIMRRRASSLAS